MQEVLREEGYVASNTEKYPVGGIISAIQNAFHATPEIQCKGDAVEELRLCFYKDFEVRSISFGIYVKLMFHLFLHFQKLTSRNS